MRLTFMISTEIRAAQLAALRHMLAALVPGNAFYSGKLSASGLGCELAGRIDLDGFSRRFPFTTKAELVADQAAYPPFGSNLTFSLDAYSRFHQTSGSSGRPLRWLDTPASWQWMLGNWLEVFRVAGVSAADRCFFAFSFGPFLGFWTAFEAAHQLGCLCIPGGGMRSQARLQAIWENGATVLCCTPTYAIHLGRLAAEEGLSPASNPVKSVIMAGEPGGCLPAVRAHIGRYWPGARLIDHHGMTEVGPASFQCPALDDVLHLIEPAFIGEIIDPVSLEPVDPGETGELVLTNLGRIGSPLLRYRTGDLVRRATDPHCVCGSWQLALVGGILGRADDMVIVRGVNLYPAAVEEVLRGFPEVAEFRVRVLSGSGLDEIRLDLEPATEVADPGELACRVGAALHAAFNLRVLVEAVACDTLPRFELKSKRWIRDEQ